MNKVVALNLHNVSNKAKKTAHAVQRKARAKLNKVKRKTGQDLNRVTRKVQREANDINKKVNHFVQKEPVSALAIAVGVGALLGLWLSK